MSYVYVSIAYDDDSESVYEAIKAASDRRSLSTIRTDRGFVTRGPVSVQVHRQIRDSRVVVADISGSNPNVMNEVGLAEAFGKPLILITRDNPESAPFNVRNLQLLKYQLKIEELRSLQEQLERALSQATSPNETLRAMLVPSTLGTPTRESWFVIAASPLSFRRAAGRQGGYKRLRRTSSDYVGIRGIMQSFGLLFGFDSPS